jgi:SAM-dependent methyltransferase
MQIKQVLHVGCGAKSAGGLHQAFADGWREVRLDVDPAVLPDLVSSITDMRVVVDDASFDAVFSAHNLEHLYPHEVPRALREFRRVLRPDGFALVTMPDLQEVSRLVADGALSTPAYLSPAGPITPLDMIYGLNSALAAGNLFMAHRTGFTGTTLSDALLGAGFGAVCVQRNPFAFALWAIAFCEAPSDARMQAAQDAMLPLRVGMPVPQTGRAVQLAG